MKKAPAIFVGEGNMKCYKCLRLNRASWYDGEFIWPLRKAVEVKGAEKGEACGVGLHLAKSINDAFRYGGFPARVFEVKPLSPILGEDESKIRVAKAKLGENIILDYVLAVNKFLKSIPKIKWFANREPSKFEWKLFENRDAAGDAAWAAAGDAAWDAAWAAAWNAAGDAAWAAAGDAARAAARDAARDAARAAARNAARDAAGDAAWAAAWNAAGGAALIAQVLICRGLKLDKKHIVHAEARWDVWKRGYGLLCDVDGIFYVYKKI